MTKSREYIDNFIKNIYSDNYADAQVNLKNAVNQKLKDKMASLIKDSKIKE